MNRVVEERMIKKRLIEALSKTEDWTITKVTRIMGGSKASFTEAIIATRPDGLWVEHSHPTDMRFSVGSAPHEVPQAEVQIVPYDHTTNTMDPAMEAWLNLVKLSSAPRERRPALDLLGVDQ